MDYLEIGEGTRRLVEGAGDKAGGSVWWTVVRGAFGAVVLSLALVFACEVAAETKVPVLGALVFPAGLAMVVLSGTELYTSTSAAVFVAGRAGLARWGRVGVATVGVYGGNVLGGLLVAAVLWGGLTMCGGAESSLGAVQRLNELAAAKVKYVHYGAAGLGAAFLKGVLCNFLLCTGVVLAACSQSVFGKVTGAWVGAALFFALGFEHSVVNMFLVPFANMMGAGVGWGDFVWFNLVPVTAGNWVGGVLAVWPLWVVGRVRK